MPPACLIATFGMLADVDPISGGAGWIGAGLLGLVLGWLLLKHLPDKDQQLKDLLTLKDGQITEAIKSHQAIQERSVSGFTENLGHALETFSACLREERSVYQKWHEENRGRMDGIKDDIGGLKGDLKEQRHYISGLAHLLGMRQVAEGKLQDEAKAREEGDRA